MAGDFNNPMIKSCPCACMMAPYLAAGYFFCFLDDLFGQAVQEILVLTAGLTENDRAKVISDWEKGREIIRFFFKRKLDYWLQLPCVMFVLGLVDEEEAISVYILQFQLSNY